MDDPPVIKQNISDVHVDEDAPDDRINLKNVFTDPDSNDDLIQLTVWQNTNPEIVTPVITDQSLCLTFSPDRYGTSEIVIMATSNGKHVSDTFLVRQTIRKSSAPVKKQVIFLMLSLKKIQT